MKLASPSALKASPRMEPPEPAEAEEKHAEILANLDHFKAELAKNTMSRNIIEAAIAKWQNELEDWELEQSAAQERGLDQEIERRMEELE